MMTKELASSDERNASFRRTEYHPPEFNQFAFNVRGAHLDELMLKGNLLLTSVIRGDKPGERKATHPCTPIFGTEGKQSALAYGLSKQHGSARDEVWQVLQREQDLITLTHRIQDGCYPDGVDVVQTAALRNDVFALTTTHQNNGCEKAPVNFAEHFYFNTPFGWEGIQLNGANITELLWDDKPLPHVLRLSDVNSLKIPGFPEFCLEQTGLPFAVLWVGGDALGNKDQHYITLEPCEGNPFELFFGSEESMIHPGSERKTELAIHF